MTPYRWSSSIYVLYREMKTKNSVKMKRLLGGTAKNVMAPKPVEKIRCFLGAHLATPPCDQLSGWLTGNNLFKQRNQARCPTQATGSDRFGCASAGPGNEMTSRSIAGSLPGNRRRRTRPVSGPRARQSEIRSRNDCPFPQAPGSRRGSGESVGSLIAAGPARKGCRGKIVLQR